MTVIPMRPCRVGRTPGGRDWGYLFPFGTGALVTGVQHAGWRDGCCACMHGCGEKQRERGEGKACKGATIIKECKGATTIKEEKSNIVFKIRTSFSFFSFIF